jgi:twitching motility protein PilT
VLIASRRLGEFLLERRVLSRDVLDELLAAEASTGVHLSRLLVDAGLVSDKDLLAGIAEQIGVRFIDLAEEPIRPDVHGLVPEDLARKHLAVAVDRIADRVVVAMEDPSDLQVIATISDAIGAPAESALAVRDELLRVIAETYGPSPRHANGAAAAPAGSDGAAGAAPAASPESPKRRAGRVSIDDILGAALDAGASDVHLTVGSVPCVRIDGELTRLDGFERLTGSEMRRLLYAVLGQRQREQFERELELDTSHALPGRGRFRLNAFLQRDSVAVVLRAVPGEILPFERLGVPDPVRRASDLHRGLVVITGGTRSGRSTTLASIVDAINHERACHILTVEDPIEFLHGHEAAIVNQRQVGDDTGSVARAVRQALRQDPDVLLVGALPDLDTIATVISAAEAGVLVLACMSVPYAVDAVSRLVDVFPPDDQAQVRGQLAASLQVVSAQQLVPSRHSGRVLACEVLVGTPMIRDFIREGRLNQLSAAMSVGGEGMQMMEQALARLVQVGQVSVDIAADRCAKPEELRRLVRATPPSSGRRTAGVSVEPDAWAERESLRR